MEIRLQERKALVQDYCKRHNRNADTVLDKDLLISTYFAAGNSFTVLYPKSQAQIEKKKELSALVQEDKHIHGRLKNSLSKFPRQEVEQKLKNYFTFLFIRDPMKRVLSAYNSEFMKDNKYFHRTYGRGIIKRYRPYATKQALETGSGVTFPEFMRHVVETNSRDEHWQSFDRLFQPCAVL